MQTPESRTPRIETLYFAKLVADHIVGGAVCRPVLWAGPPAGANEAQRTNRPTNEKAGLALKFGST